MKAKNECKKIKVIVLNPEAITQVRINLAKVAIKLFLSGDVEI